MGLDYYLNTITNTLFINYNLFLTMSWLKLLSHKGSIAELTRPQFTNGTWRKPVIQAR